MNKNHDGSSFLFLFLTALFSFSLLGACSSTAPIENETFINYVYNNCPEAHMGGFAYCLKTDDVSSELIAKANYFNSIFYNEISIVALVEHTSYSYQSNDVLFSNSSRLNKEEAFTTNHLQFYSTGGVKLIDLNLFENNTCENILESDKTIAPIIIPYNVANDFALKHDIDIADVLYKEFIFDDNDEENESFIIAGVWDDNIVSRSYYQFNSFYVELGKPVFFINDSTHQFKAESNLDTYLCLGRNVSENLKLYHYIVNALEKTPSFSVPNYKINSWTINGMTLVDVFQQIITDSNSNQIKQIAYVFIVSSILLGIWILGLFIYNFLEMRRNELTNYFLKYSWIVGTLMGVAIFASLQKITIGTRKIFAFNKYALSAIVILSLLMTFITFISFKRDEEDIVKEEHKEITNGGVCFISFDDLSCQSAGSKRLNGYIKAVSDAGIPYSFVGLINKNETNSSTYTLRKFNNKIFNYLFLPIFARIELTKAYEEHKFSTLFIYSPLPLFTSISINQFAKWYHVKTVHDVCEFQNFKQVNKKKPGWFYISNAFYNKFLIGKDSNVIVISQYLKKYFEDRQAKTLVIPPIFDKNSIPQLKKTNNELTFTYLGNPGKKDNLQMCIEGFIEALKTFDKLPNIKVKFFGTNNNYENIFSTCSQEIRDKFVFNGRISANEIEDVYRNSSFTFFIRDPNMRYSKAGFPSKVIESLFYDTPVITNKTSDLDMYFEENKSAIWCEDYSVKGFADAIVKVIKNYDNYSSEFVHNSRKLAEERFDISLYSEDILKFIKIEEKAEITEVQEI